ncbi:hypothetical protein NMY3_03589 [Candidatus Nitrosocosmicus oleophilus]|uniref:Uncharacterized protein n=1 Tax=Candidatus Nitrosocosmicus oleophilus TaxID=1353260 RepID=A0A654M527_9ARCH|nr:hypothetical protein NMY3_03589 [Candidatus Nitrosocosmicus oleophilus]
MKSSFDYNQISTKVESKSIAEGKYCIICGQVLE